MKIFDLSVTFEPKEKTQALGVDIKYSGHEEGVMGMLPFFDCKREDLPGGRGWAGETLTLSTHDGTHVDAPWHYAPVSEGKKARTIDEMPIEWFFGNGVVLDMQHKPKGAAITTTDLKAALKKIKHTLKPGDIVCLQTGAAKYWGTLDYFFAGCGLVRESTLWLIEQGVRIIGTDAWGLDRPFDAIRADFQRTHDKTIIWSAHYAGIEKEYCQIEKLTNLDKLPRPTGFKIACFPVKIRGASAGWVRVAAIFEDM
jgi:kynurenine formamidase